MRPDVLKQTALVTRLARRKSSNTRYGSFDQTGAQRGQARKERYTDDVTLRIQIAVVGDAYPSVPSHRAIPIAARLASSSLGGDVATESIQTKEIGHVPTDLIHYDAVWCAPCPRPYENPEGVVRVIQWGRQQKVPFLGTCAGFQFALIEYSRNVLRATNTAHAEIDPTAPDPLIAPLVCSLFGTEGDMSLVPGSILHKAYGTLTIKEPYRCSYVLNSNPYAAMFEGDLHVTACDATGDVWGIELSGHPFYVGTLFQPEQRALKGGLPPVVPEFVQTVERSKASYRFRVFRQHGSEELCKMSLVAIIAKSTT
jgi:CTP synthase (UTP-ammonia lyase)